MPVYRDYITSTGESYFILDEIKDVDEPLKRGCMVGVHGGLRNVIPAAIWLSMMAGRKFTMILGGEDEIRRGFYLQTTGIST